MSSRRNSRRKSFTLAELETPGCGIDGGIELAPLEGNVESSLQYEESDGRYSHKHTHSLSLELISINNDLGSPQQPQKPMMLGGFDYKDELSLVHELSETEDSIQLYGKPDKPFSTPMQAQEYTPGDGNTQGGQEGEVSSQGQEDPTPGGFVAPWVDDFQEFMDWDEDIDNIQRSDIGDCHFIWKHKKCCFICSVFLFFLILICLLLAPRPLHLCINFSFDDEKAIDKVFGDVGNFDLKITNPNYVPVSLHGFAINAYYGGVADGKEVINVERSDYSIGAQHTFNTNNETYFFAQKSTDVVPLAALDSCSAGYRTDMTYDLVTTFKGCLSFMCKNSIVLKSSYVNHCLEEDGWFCTKLDILG